MTHHPTTSILPTTDLRPRQQQHAADTGLVVSVVLNTCSWHTLAPWIVCANFTDFSIAVVAESKLELRHPIDVV
jgi:hypothetical protein